MRKHLYQDLVRILNGIPEIEHVDLWNRNVEFIEEDEAFPMPAVFVEFGQIDWTPMTGSVLHWRGSGTMNLHIVTEWNGKAEPGTDEMEQNLLGWRIAEKVHKALEGRGGKGYDSLYAVSTITNHDHEDIVDNIEVYRFKARRVIKTEEQA